MLARLKKAILGEESSSPISLIYGPGRFDELKKEIEGRGLRPATIGETAEILSYAFRTPEDHEDYKHALRVKEALSTFPRIMADTAVVQHGDFVYVQDNPTIRDGSFVGMDAASALEKGLASEYPLNRVVHKRELKGITNTRVAGYRENRFLHALGLNKEVNKNGSCYGTDSLMKLMKDGSFSDLWLVSYPFQDGEVMVPVFSTTRTYPRRSSDLTITIERADLDRREAFREHCAFGIKDK